MSFTWVEPRTKHSPRLTNSMRIAAVRPETDAIVVIFPNSVRAARTLIEGGYFPNPSTQLVYETARTIAAAADGYHIKVLGYYWKWIH